MELWLNKFVDESNRIEGILHSTTQHIEAHEAFLALESVAVSDLVELVGELQPNAMLRDKPNVPGVRVGSHIAPPSGPGIVTDLEEILFQDSHPFETHIAYETLHPFTDGNGRSGRALWLWQMMKGRHEQMARKLGFLHSFYYQTLSKVRI